jgi:vitamin B12 transporter
VVALALPTVAAAQAAGGGAATSPDEAGAAAATAVAQVVVTANRTPSLADHVGQSFTVLTLDQIRLDQETQVADMLTRTPGITLTQNGGPGGVASIFIRGADSDETLVLIDGVKVNDPSDPATSYDFSNLYAGDIARIEVLRGPQSTLYGSEAMGGVVNIITAAATKPLEGDIQAEGGSYGTAYVRLAPRRLVRQHRWRLRLRQDLRRDRERSVPCRRRVGADQVRHHPDRAARRARLLHLEPQRVRRLRHAHPQFRQR